MKGLSMGGEITIRQVTSMDRKLEVRERMKRRYAFRNYPDEFTFRCKCIIVFQNLDGVDTILFGLYVYEHDEKNPAPNTRTVKNFKTAHIWACPPLKGDDYILYAKPEDQKIPKDDRLRQWYCDMLVETQKRGIVGKVTNIYDLYFADERNDASVVPYMEGDYFPAEAENIIKDIEEGKSGKKGSSAGKKKTSNKSKTKKKSNRGGTRSAGLDEESKEVLAASGMLPQGMSQQALEAGGRDYVMAKLGDTIQPMKESFFVAFLACKDARPEDMVVPKEIEEYREKHGIVSKPKPPRATKPIKTSRWPKKARTRRKRSPLDQQKSLPNRRTGSLKRQSRTSSLLVLPSQMLSRLWTLPTHRRSPLIPSSQRAGGRDSQSQICGFCIRR